MTRPSRADYWPEFPWIGGTGSTHDMDDREPRPRLEGMKSVSRKAAWALKPSRWPDGRPVGFVHFKD